MQDSTNFRPEAISLTHDQPLVAEEPAEKPKNIFNKKISKKALLVSFIIILLFGASLIFAWPRVQSTRFASSTRGSVSNLFTNLDSVNSSLTSLFRFTTNNREADAELSRLNHSFKRFNLIIKQTADANQKDGEGGKDIGLRLNDLLEDLSAIFKNIEISERGKVGFGGNVQGFTTPADDPNKIYRDQRDIAVKVIGSIEESEKAIEDLEEQLSRRGIPNSFQSLKQDLNELKSLANEYLSEAQKTADYYVLISDLSIELEGNFDSFQLSLQSSASVNSLVGSFDQISKDLKGLKGELEVVDNKSLPADIEDLHQDSIELFTIVINYFDQLKVLTLKEDSKGIVDLTNHTSVELNQIIIKGTDHELSFWKNNKVLNSYDSISERHTELLKKLEEEEDKNNILNLNF